MFHPRLVLIVAILFALALASWRLTRTALNSSDQRAHYTKYEYRVPMRDGVKLFTQVYVPKNRSQNYPFLVARTPFGVAPYGENLYRRPLGPSEAFDRAGYIFVFQDIRGRYQSEGQFIDMRPHLDHPKAGETDESTDMSDTVDWLLKNVPGNNGKVGIWGISYQGFYTSASIIDSHPAIKAASPEAPMTNLFKGDDAYHNGAFMLAAQFEIYSNYFKPRPDGPEYPAANLGGEFDYGTKDGYEFFLQHGPDLKHLAALIHNPFFDENMQHDTYDDYWQTRDISKHLHGIHCAVLNVGGWFDAEDLAGTFRTYHAIEENNPGLKNMLVVGPWRHREWVRSDGTSLGPMQFNSATGDFFREHMAFPFFEHYLKGKEDADLPEAYVFQTGRNRWLYEDAWPPKKAQQRALYLRAQGKLSFDPPVQGEAAYDNYVSDPKNPVPYVAHPPTDVAAEYMYGDQRFAATRPDVLTYLSDPLTQDMTVVGPVSPRLQVSTSGTDSDFDVKLIDVYPEAGAYSGYQQLVRGEPMRAKFRKSFSTPEALVPNQVTPLNFEMPDVNHTFLRGHRIMVQVQSSWFPLTDLNPQKFVDTSQATPSDFTKVTERVFHSPQTPSNIVLNLLPQH